MADRATLDDLRARIAVLEGESAASVSAEGSEGARGRQDTPDRGSAEVEAGSADAHAGDGEGVGAGSVGTADHHVARPPAARVRARGDSELPESERAFRKIERLACRREQASEALRRRLARDGFEPTAIDEALARAVRCGLVDDGRFAEVLVRSRLAQGRGRRGIAAELADLGIDASGIAVLFDDTGGDDDEVERALSVLDRRPPKAKNRRDAAYRRLVQKGFAAAVASSAARLWCERNPV